MLVRNGWERLGGGGKDDLPCFGGAKGAVVAPLSFRFCGVWEGECAGA